MIALWRIEIFHKKDGSKLTELDVVGSDKESMETDNFQKKKAMRNAGYDITTDKWDIDKFDFKATLKKFLENG